VAESSDGKVSAFLRNRGELGGEVEHLVSLGHVKLCRPRVRQQPVEWDRNDVEFTTLLAVVANADDRSIDSRRHDPAIMVYWEGLMAAANLVDAQNQIAIWSCAIDEVSGSHRIDHHAVSGVFCDGHGNQEGGACVLCAHHQEPG